MRTSDGGVSCCGPVNTLLRRRIALLAVMPALIAAACSGGAAPTTTTTTTFVVVTTVPPTTPTTAVIEPPPVSGTLTVWANPSLADAVRSRAVLFTADTGISVTVVPAVEADILPAVLDGSGALPDVFIGPHTWVYELAIAGITEPVTLGENLPAGIVEAVSLRTFPLGIPLAVDALIQVRNPSLVATRPTAAESIDCQGCFVLPADGAFDVTYPFVTTLGGYLFGPDPDNGYDPTVTGVDSEEAVAAATVLESLVTAGAVTTATNRNDVLARFAAGEAGIIWAGPEAIGLLSGEAVESLPTIGNAAAVSPIRVLTAYVNARGPLKAAAAKFAERYLGDPDGSREFANSAAMAPVWAAAATDTELLVLDAAETGHAVPYAPETESAWAEMSAAFASILLGTKAEEALIDAGDNIRFADTAGAGG